MSSFRLAQEPAADPGAASSPSNLATPMFLLDAAGMLVFYNDAAALLLGKPFAELGEMSAGDFAATLELATPAGESLLRRELPRGHRVLPAAAGARVGRRDHLRRRRAGRSRPRRIPLFATTGDMHGVIAVFWDG